MELVAWEKRINSNLSAIQRAGCASVTYKDRFVLIVGGRFHDTFYLDCWSYDTSSGALNALSTGPKNCHPRAYHTATLIDGVVWVIGGSDDDTIHTDDPIWCFDVKTRVWTQPKLKGNLLLLRRTAHGACLHPTMPGCILLFGGYGIINQQKSNAAEVSFEPEWLSDLVLVNTRTNTVESIKPKGEKAPISRAYHSFSAVGNLCVALFGRSANKHLVPAKKSAAIYDAQAAIWLDITDKDIKGTIPQVRSSHRACTVAGGGGGGGSSGSGGVVIFGGAPPAPFKKIDRLSDMHLLKITPSPPTSTRRAASSNTSKYQLEWVSCGNGEADLKGSGGAGAGTSWPIGRGAHAQEYINGKVCLFGGYCRHEKYCTDVWEGLVAVEGQQPVGAPAAAPAAVAGGGAVCNDPSATAAAPLKWRNIRGKVENEINILQKILPAIGAKRQRGGGAAAGTKNSPPQPLLEPNAAVVTAVTIPAKRMKRQFLDPVENRKKEEMVTVPFNPPGTSSPSIVPGARRISALEQEIKSLREALLEQRAKEAALLRGSNTAKDDAFKLKQELQKADENWRKASEDRDDWKLRFNDLQKLIEKAETERNAAVTQVAAAHEKWQEALRRCKATATIAEQKQKALDDAAAQKAQLLSTTAALQGALDKATVETEKERQLRMSICEQNKVLQTNFTTAETEKEDIKRRFELERSSFDALKIQWEAEQGLLQRELSSTKNNLAAVKRDLETSKQQEDDLKSVVEKLQLESTVLKSKVQRLEAESRVAAEERERGEAENKKLKDDVHRLQREMDDKQRNIDTEFDAIHRALQKARGANDASGSRRQ